MKRLVEWIKDNSLMLFCVSFSIYCAMMNHRPDLYNVVAAGLLASLLTFMFFIAEEVQAMGKDSMLVATVGLWLAVGIIIGRYFP